MGTAERRAAIIKTLCRRRHETMMNLALEFGVSERTIRRDIEVLSLTEPIYTQTGRYGGGVYVVEDYSIDRMYVSEEEAEVLRKLYVMAENQQKCALSECELTLFQGIVTEYCKPKHRKGK